MWKYVVAVLLLSPPVLAQTGTKPNAPSAAQNDQSKRSDGRNGCIEVKDPGASVIYCPPPKTQQPNAGTGVSK
jgi:hypothetical protein